MSTSVLSLYHTSHLPHGKCSPIIAFEEAYSAWLQEHQIVETFIGGISCTYVFRCKNGFTFGSLYLGRDLLLQLPCDRAHGLEISKLVYLSLPFGYCVSIRDISIHHCWLGHKIEQGLNHCEKCIGMRLALYHVRKIGPIWLLIDTLQELVADVKRHIAHVLISLVV